MIEIILEESWIYLIKNKTLLIVKNDDPYVEILECDIDVEFDKIFVYNKAIFILYKNLLYLYDEDSEKSTLIKEFDSMIVGNFKNLFLEAFINQEEIIIKEYKIEKNSIRFIKENKADFKESINPMINNIDIFANSYKLEKKEIKENYLCDFAVNEDYIFLIQKDELFLFEKQLNKYSIIKLPYISTMDSKLELRDNFLLIDSKNNYQSTILTIELDDLNKINILKKGLDKINTYLSKNGKFLLAAYGEENNYPMIVNIEKNLPIIVFDSNLNNNFNICANDDLSMMVMSDFEIIRLYSWENSKFTLEEEIEL